ERHRAGERPLGYRAVLLAPGRQYASGIADRKGAALGGGVRFQRIAAARSAAVPLQARARLVGRTALPRRIRESFSASAVLTKLCNRTSLRTQNSLSSRATRRGMRVAS